MKIAKGNTKIMAEADVVIGIESDGTWRLIKSRLQPLTIVVIEEEAV